ncbi:unnamed protein product [Sphagnum balticum]
MEDGEYIREQRYVKREQLLRDYRGSQLFRSKSQDINAKDVYRISGEVLPVGGAADPSAKDQLPEEYAVTARKPRGPHYDYLL